MHRRVFAALGVAVAAAAVAGAAVVSLRAGGAADDAAARGTIAFVRAGSPEYEPRLYLMNGDGSAQRVAATRADGFPVWSPDGRKIAYYVLGEVARIYVAKADGSGRRAVTPRGFADFIEIAWSRDSRRIAYALNYEGEGGSAIYVVNADGSGRKRLTVGRQAYDINPAWSPDGRKLLFTRMTYDRPRGGYKTALYVMRADGREKRVIRGAYPSESPSLPTSGRPGVAWSRDGTRIFVAGGGLYVMNVDGTGRRTLISPLPFVQSFALSPDWRRIVVGGIGHYGKGEDIYVLNADGSERRKLTNTPFREFDPQWSPDGRRIAFSRAARWGAQDEIFVMNADGTDVANLSQHPSNDLAPAWRPLRKAG